MSMIPKTLIRSIRSVVDEVRREDERAASVTWLEASQSLLHIKQTVLKHRPATIGTYKALVSAIRRRSPWFAQMLICDITPSDYIRALEQSFNGEVSREYARRALSGIFSHAIKTGWSARNPNAQIYRRRIEEREKIALTPEQVRMLFYACREATEEEKLVANKRRIGVAGAKMNLSSSLAPLAIMTFGGVRPEEMERLRWDDVNFEEGLISIRRYASKTGIVRHVAMNATMRAWLRQCAVDTGLICPKGWSYRWAGIRHRAGWDSLSNPWIEDSLRHTFAAYHLKKYHDIPRLQVEMGHSSSSLIWRRYANMKGVTDQAAREFWGITPQSMYICD